MLNTFILIIMIVTQVLGDVCLSNGMKIYGEIISFSPAIVIDVIDYLLHSIWFYLGMLCLSTSWFVYLFSVSKMDLSYVLPINAASYICNALLAWLILHEEVSANRWLATGLISLGVFIVGYSKYLAEKQDQHLLVIGQVNQDNLQKMLLTLSAGVVLPVVWLGVIVMVLSDSIGDVLTAKGMREIERLTSLSVSRLSRWFGQILTNFNIIIGMFCQIIALFLFIALLSWDDLSFIRPASAVSYLVTVTSAKYVLKEKISRGRFMGIGFIFIGVLLLSLR